MRPRGTCGLPEAALRMVLNLTFVAVLNSCATAALFSLPNRSTEEANNRQFYMATAALPVALAVDVVTSPVQLGAAGAYSIAKSAKASEAKEGDGSKSGGPPVVP